MGSKGDERGLRVGWHSASVQASNIFVFLARLVTLLLVFSPLLLVFSPLRQGERPRDGLSELAEAAKDAFFRPRD